MQEDTMFLGSLDMIRSALDCAGRLASIAESVGLGPIIGNLHEKGAILSCRFRGSCKDLEGGILVYTSGVRTGEFNNFANVFAFVRQVTPRAKSAFNAEVVAALHISIPYGMRQLHSSLFIDWDDEPIHANLRRYFEIEHQAGDPVDIDRAGFSGLRLCYSIHHQDQLNLQAARLFQMLNHPPPAFCEKDSTSGNLNATPATR